MKRKEKEVNEMTREKEKRHEGHREKQLLLDKKERK